MIASRWDRHNAELASAALPTPSSARAELGGFLIVIAILRDPNHHAVG
jgi:hypothetical protein